MASRGVHGTNIQPNNLGRIETVPKGATQLVVAFAPAVNTSEFAQCAGQPGASTLTPGTYYYAATRVGARGETGIGNLGSPSHRSITVMAGQRVVMRAHGTDGRYRDRFYRARQVGVWDGFVEVDPGTVLTDDGSLTWMPGEPGPDGVSIPGEHEVDADYAIVATPGWNTYAWVSSKSTTGFTVNFANPAPDGATIQWLMFRS